MIDGVVARKTNTSGEFGARFDTAADFLLVVVCLIKLLPVLDIPVWITIWIAVIALIKFINIISGYVMRKRFVSVHSLLNRITGILLFALPLTLPVIDLSYSGPVACVAATFAAMQEGHFMRKGRE